MGSITSANAIVTIAVANLFPVPQQLQGFAADNVYEVNALDLVETSMGVDGILSGGMVFNPVEQTFVLQADSPSNAIFDAWFQAQQTAVDVFVASGSTILPSTGQQYESVTGFLTSWQVIPTAARTLQPRRAVIRWQRIFPQNI